MVSTDVRTAGDGGWDRSTARDSPGQKHPVRAREALRSRLKFCFKMKASSMKSCIKTLLQSRWHNSTLRINRLRLPGEAAGDISTALCL